MKKIIICEGDNDALFYDEFFKKIHVKKRLISVYNAKYIFKKGFKEGRYIESKKIRNFIGSSKNIFLKAEQGKGYVTKVYSSIVNDIPNERPILSIDLDNEKYTKYVRRLEKRIQKQTETMKLFPKIYVDNHRIITLKISIKCRNNHLTDAYLFAFKFTLELEANINKGMDESKKRNKIRRLLKSNDIINPLKEIINI